MPFLCFVRNMTRLPVGTGRSMNNLKLYEDVKVLKIFGIPGLKNYKSEFLIKSHYIKKTD